MTGPPRPVRVVVRIDRSGPGPSAAAAAHDVAEQTELGAVLLRSLVRAQLGLALRVLAVVAVVVGAVPLSFALDPRLWDRQVLGVPVALVALGAGAYPVLLVAGWYFVRRSERHEVDFIAVVERS